MSNECLGRWIMTPSGLVEGYLEVSEDRVDELCFGKAPDRSSRAVILPGLVNAHTHLADSVAYPAPKGTVEQLVAPPSGYKHVALSKATRSEKRKAIRSAVELMLRTGTTAFIDFREEGLHGVADLIDALPTPSPCAVVLGRPLAEDASEGEIDSLLERCDGIGMSSVSDWPIDFLERVSRRTRACNKMFAVHASESVREDIEVVLGLRPDFVVHMTRASEGDISACVDANVPIVVCPRANEFYGLAPDIPMMLRLGATVALGTDNGMISRPDLIEELKAAYRIGRTLGELTPVEVVSLATFGGRKVLNQAGKILTETGADDDLVVVGIGRDDPLLDLVTSARSEDVCAVAKGGRVWRAQNWRR